MDKTAIIEIIKSHPEMDHDAVKTQAMSTGVDETLFEEAWNEAKAAPAAEAPATPAPVTPVAPVAPAGPAKAEASTFLKKKSVVMVILLTIITAGIYIPIWYMGQAKALKSLNTKAKLGQGAIALMWITLAAYLVVEYVLPTVNADLADFSKLYGDWFSIAFGIVNLTAAFKMRSILNEAYDVKSWVFGVFIFNLFWLQGDINKIVRKQANPA